jgi:hypothetical protein
VEKTIGRLPSRCPISLMRAAASRAFAGVFTNGIRIWR